MINLPSPLVQFEAESPTLRRHQKQHPRPSCAVADETLDEFWPFFCCFFSQVDFPIFAELPHSLNVVMALWRIETLLSVLVTIRRCCGPSETPRHPCEQLPHNDRCGATPDSVFH